MAEATTGALAGLRIVEWGSGFSAPLCARLLGDLGAEVVKLELPPGDWTRGDPLFPALNFNKRSIAADPTTDIGRAAIARLIAGADALIENQPVGALAAAGFYFAALQRLRPGLVLASLSPFGQSGPRRQWKGEDLIGCHAGALAAIVPDWVDDPSKPPLRPAPRQAELLAALHGAVAVLGALLGRERGLPALQAGVHIDVATQECVASILHSSLPEVVITGNVRDRFSPTIVFAGFTPARDGRARLMAVTEPHWQKLGALIGAAELVRSPDRRGRLSRREEIEQRAAEWAAEQTKQAIYHAGQRQRLPFAPVNRPSEALRQPQFVAREAFVPVPWPDGGRRLLPGAPFCSSETPWRLYRGAPRPGEASESEAWGSGGDVATKPHPPNPVPKSPDPAALPLRGVRVADFSWAWAGPHCALQLADLGAEVIKVESRERLDTARLVGPYPAGTPIDPDRSLRFAAFNRGKAGITLNLRDANGLALARRLVQVCDVVVENYASGVMARLGLDYDTLRALRPDLVMISLSGFGQTGPERDYVAYGYTMEAFSGLAETTGYPGGPPEALGLPYADPVGGLLGAVAVLAALRYRDRGGRGQYIDLSEAEALLFALTEPYALLAETGVDPPRLGNADRRWSPHGVYPCRNGRWIAIAVTSDTEWGALVQAMGEPDWATAARLAATAGRLTWREELDRRIGAWTVEHEAAALSERLQAVGVPAVLSYHAGDLLEDEHLRARGFFQPVPHPGWATLPIYSAPYRFGARPLPIRRAAPRLGEDNAQVLGSLLGVGDAERSRLAEHGALR